MAEKEKTRKKWIVSILRDEEECIASKGKNKQSHYAYERNMEEEQNT